MVSRAIETKSAATFFKLYAGSDECVARSSSNPFARAVSHPHDKNLLPARHEGEQRPRHSRQRITHKDGKLAVAEFVAQITRKELEDARDRFGKTFDQADDKRRRPECERKKGRQERIDNVARGVVEETDEAKGENGGRQPAVPVPDPSW